MLIKRYLLIKLTLSIILTGMIAACGGDTVAVLTITPAGPTIVTKGSTLQFSANLAGVVWSIQGGSTNGTIDSSGLYTAPATLPVNPQVTVMGTAPGGSTDTALVALRTADVLDITGTNIDTLNDTPVMSLGSSTFSILFGSSSFFDTRNGSHKTSAIWNNLDDMGTIPITDDEIYVDYSMNLDFLGFDPEKEILRGEAMETFVGGSLCLDSLLNPYFLVISGFTGSPIYLSSVGSSDGGNTFGSLKPFPPPSPVTDSQLFGTLHIDSQDIFHTAFTKGPNPTNPGVDIINLRYGYSTDDGDTWNILNIFPGDANVIPLAPAIDVSPAGVIHVCWTDINLTGTDVKVGYSQSSDMGQNFSAPKYIEVMNDVFSLNTLCDLALGPNGEVNISYSDGNDVYFTRSVDNGQNFVTPKKVNTVATNTDETLPRLVVDDLGRIEMFWRQDPTNDTNPEQLALARSTDGGDTFSITQPVPLNGNPTEVIPTGLRYDQAGRLFWNYLSDQNDPGNSNDVFINWAE